MGVTLFPLVESLNVFTKNIPKPLRSINGVEWDDARLPGDILKAFGLTRQLRQAFISYKRSDSAGIAEQLAHILFDRGYQVFLDTASIESRAPSRSPPRAPGQHRPCRPAGQPPRPRLGVGPRGARPGEPAGPRGPPTGLDEARPGRPDRRQAPGHPGDRVQLRSRSSRGTSGTLRRRSGPMPSSGRSLEEVAIAGAGPPRSLLARRMRVVSYVRAEASRLDQAVNLQPAAQVELLHNGRVIFTALPIVGLPDAWVIHQQERRIREGPARPTARSVTSAPGGSSTTAWGSSMIGSST